MDGSEAPAGSARITLLESEVQELRERLREFHRAAKLLGTEPDLAKSIFDREIKLIELTEGVTLSTEGNSASRNSPDKEAPTYGVGQGYLDEAICHQFFDGISSGAVIYRATEEGKDFVILDMNAASQKIDKVNKEEIIGKRVTEVFPGVVPFGLLDVFRRVWRSGKPEHHPLGMYRDEKNAGWRENHVFRLPNGDIVANYSAETPKNILEAERQVVLAEFQGVLASTTDIVFKLDPEGRLIFW
ncbi:MAG: PAS domain-containing protein, partial [Planctomycetes bacterium]|nr:PAS domain-containing protein [Planctomycetota bacterium]